MGLFDDLLVGGAGLAFVEHEHTKHQRQRQQFALEQQAMQNNNQYQQQSNNLYRGSPQGGYQQQQTMGFQGGCCPNCGYNMQQQQQGGYGNGYQYGGSQQGVGYQPGQQQWRGTPPPVPERKQ